MKSTRKLLKKLPPKNLESRAELYTQNTVEIINELRNPEYKATLASTLISTSPDKDFRIQERKKPRTRWRSCFLGVACTSLLYVGSLLYDKNIELQSKLHDSQVEVQALATSSEKDIQRMSGKVFDYKNNIVQLNQIIKSYDNKVSDLDSQLDDSENTIQTLNEKIKNSKKTFTSLTRKINCLQGSVQDLTTKVQSYKGYIHHNAVLDLRKNKFSRTATYDKLIELYAKHLYPEADKAFIELVGKYMRDNICPLKGKTKEETYQIWNSKPTSIKFHIGKSEGK